MRIKIRIEESAGSFPGLQKESTVSGLAACSSGILLKASGSFLNKRRLMMLSLGVNNAQKTKGGQMINFANPSVSHRSDKLCDKS